jgi:hypothetical protein
MLHSVGLLLFITHHSSCRGDWRTIKKSRPPACWRPPQTLHKPDDTAHRFCFLPNHFTATCWCNVGQQLVQQDCNMQPSCEWSLVSRNTKSQSFRRWILSFRGLKCHSVLICNTRKSKCRCKLNGNGKGNEYETRVRETERGAIREGWRKGMILRH